MYKFPMGYILFLTLEIISQLAVALPISTTIDGGYSYGKHLECRAYLHQPANGKYKTDNHLLLHFFQAGTGIYTTYADEPWTMSTDYYLTIDKPGIIPNPNDPTKPFVDRALFDYYTTDTLVNCAQNALLWATDYLKNKNVSIVLGGHSEGSIVMTRLTYKILSDPSQSQIQSELSSLFLSGVVMDDMSDVLAFQLNKLSYSEFMFAYQKHDDNYFYKNYQVGWYWVDNSLRSHYPVKKILDDIATLNKGRTLPIQIFQGLWDRNVPTKSVLSYEKNNTKKTADQALLISSRYYNGGHALNAAAISDMQMLINAYFIKNNCLDCVDIHSKVMINDDLHFMLHGM